MSHSQIQKYRPVIVNGEPRFWCNILRAYVSMSGRKPKERTFYPPMGNSLSEIQTTEKSRS